MNSKKESIIEQKTKSLIEHYRNVGLFSISIIFGLIVGIGGNVIYDWYIKENTISGLFFLLATLFLIGFFIKTARDVERKINKLEEEIKKLR